MGGRIVRRIVGAAGVEGDDVVADERVVGRGGLLADPADGCGGHCVCAGGPVFVSVGLFGMAEAAVAGRDSLSANCAGPVHQ